jgi:hypothetical protein
LSWHPSLNAWASSNRLAWIKNWMSCLVYSTYYRIVLRENLLARYWSKATRKSSSNGEPSLMFLFRIRLTFCLFFFMPVVVDKEVSSSRISLMAHFRWFRDKLAIMYIFQKSFSLLLLYQRRLWKTSRLPSHLINGCFTSGLNQSLFVHSDYI